MAKVRIISTPALAINSNTNLNRSSIGSGDLPPIPEVMTKIRPVPIEDANAEIEKGELVLDPETGSIHKALGRPHAKGGTPVSLKENSFIFSNFKDLAISKKQKELFEFKMGGSKAKNNTPSKVLEKEIDLEHHNKMVDILHNEKKHNITENNSAQLMFLKNMEKAGQVAFIQESKKNEATPSFAMNTAPIYSNDTDEKITQAMQYLKTGGRMFQRGGSASQPETFFVYGPNGEITEKRDMQGNVIERYNGNKQSAPVKSTSPRRDRTEGTQPPYPDNWTNYYDRTNNTQYTAPDWISPKDFYGVPGLIDYMKTLNNKPGIDNDMGKANDSTWGWRHRAAQAKFFPNAHPLQRQTLDVQPITSGRTTTDNIIPRQQTQTGNKPDDQNGIVDRTNYKTSITPWQGINMAIPFYRAAKVKTQYPLRQHQESVIPQFENQNVQPILNNNNQSYFNASNTLRTLNPSQASSYMQQLYGNRTDANNQAISGVQNNNIQTQNRQREMAASSLNNDAAQNRAFDLKYYDQTKVAEKNSDELKQAYEQQGIQGINETMTKKLAFDSWLNTQQQYRGKATYIDKDGVQHYQGVAPYTPKAGFFGYSVQNNPTNIDWANYQSPGNKIDSPEELGKAYQEMLKYMPGLTPDAFMKSRSLQNYNTSNMSVPNSFRMGGKYRNKK